MKKFLKNKSKNQNKENTIRKIKQNDTVDKKEKTQTMKNSSDDIKKTKLNIEKIKGTKSKDNVHKIKSDKTTEKNKNKVNRANMGFIILKIIVIALLALLITTFNSKDSDDKIGAKEEKSFAPTAYESSYGILFVEFINGEYKSCDDYVSPDYSEGEKYGERSYDFELGYNLFVSCYSEDNVQTDEWESALEECKLLEYYSTIELDSEYIGSSNSLGLCESSGLVEIYIYDYGRNGYSELFVEIYDSYGSLLDESIYELEISFWGYAEVAQDKIVAVDVTWEPISYTISFDGNGADEGEMESISATYDEEYTLTTNAFTREGYKFTGWNTEADGSGTSYEDGATVSNLTTTNGDTVTLYAQWEPISYSVAYEGNGNDSLIVMGTIGRNRI